MVDNPNKLALARLEKLSPTQFKKVLLIYEVPNSEIPQAGTKGEQEVAIVEYACQKEGKQLTKLLEVVNEVAPSEKIKKNGPDLRSYLINRTDQKIELRKAINAHDKQHPFLCLIHGDKYQCHDRYFDRLTQYDLPDLISVLDDNGIPCNFIPCRFHKGVDTVHQEILEQLITFSEKLGCFSDDCSGIINTIAKEESPILFYASMCTKDWSQSGGIKLVQEFIKFWADWSLPSNNHLLLICLSFTYIGEPTSFLDRLRKKIPIDDQIRQEFAQLKFNKFGVNGIVLPELKNIQKQEVEDWVREHLRSYLEIFQLEIEDIFKSDDKKTMEDLVNKINPILKEHCT